MKLTPYLERRARGIAVIAAAEKPLRELTLPMVRIRGTTNGSQGTTLAGRKFRRGKQRGLKSLGRSAAVRLRLRELAARERLVIRVQRVAPNRLDGDNLEAALKRIRDGVATAIGIDDRSPLVEYVPDDVRGGVREYALRFEVFVAPSANEELQPRNDLFDAQTEGAFGAWSAGPTPNVRKPSKVTR